VRHKGLNVIIDGLSVASLSELMNYEVAFLLKMVY